MSASNDGVKVLCNLSYKRPTGDFADLQYGNCKTLPHKMKDNDLLIEALESSGKEKIQKTSIVPNTSFAVFPSNPSHMIVPGISFLHNEPHHSTTHYIPIKPDLEMTFCTPLQCLTIPFKSYVTLQPLNFSSSIFCPSGKYLLIDYQKDSPHPKGVCIIDSEGLDQESWLKELEEAKDEVMGHLIQARRKNVMELREKWRQMREQKSNEKEFPIIVDASIDPTPAYFYYLTLSLSLDSIISRSIDSYNVSTEFPLFSPSSYTSPSITFHVYDLSHMSKEANGVSLSHHFFPIPRLSSPLFSIRTPRQVYSLSKDEDGKFQLTSHLGEGGGEEEAEKTRVKRQEEIEKEKEAITAQYADDPQNPAFATVKEQWRWRERGCGSNGKTGVENMSPTHSLVFQKFSEVDFPFLGELGEPALYSEPSWSFPPSDVCDVWDHHGTESLKHYLETYRKWNKEGRPEKKEEVEEEEEEDEEEEEEEGDEVEQEGEEVGEEGNGEETEEIDGGEELCEQWINSKRLSWDVYWMNQGKRPQKQLKQAQDAAALERQSRTVKYLQKQPEFVQPPQKQLETVQPMQKQPETVQSPKTHLEMAKPEKKQLGRMSWEDIVDVALVFVLLGCLIYLAVRLCKRKRAIVETDIEGPLITHAAPPAPEE